MDVSAILAEIVSLSVEERLRFVEAIWDSIIAEPDQPALTDAQQQELTRRRADHTASPAEVVSWEEVKAQALARVQR